MNRCLLAVWCALFLGLAGTVRGEETSPQLAALPRTAPSPAENPTTPAKVDLGKLLFFDPRLSSDDSISCATCHLPEKAFADGRARSRGFGGALLKRNTPSILNVGLLPSLFWDGRARDLEEQALAPIQSPAEMNQDLHELEREISAIPAYVSRFKEAFGSRPSPASIAQALAAFERTLISGPAPLDRYLAGDKRALSAAARDGMELFRGEAGCIECHHGPLLSDGKFYRLGASYFDEGRAAVTGKREDRFRFRTPSLRNVAQTAPYMHDGSLATLDEVVTFYFRGIGDFGPHGLRPDTSALRGQSFSDIALIVEFLHALSGKVPEIIPPQLP